MMTLLVETKSVEKNEDRDAGNNVEEVTTKNRELLAEATICPRRDTKADMLFHTVQSALDIPILDVDVEGGAVTLLPTTVMEEAPVAARFMERAELT